MYIDRVDKYMRRLYAIIASVYCNNEDSFFIEFIFSVGDLKSVHFA